MLLATAVVRWSGSFLVGKFGELLHPEYVTANPHAPQYGHAPTLRRRRLVGRPTNKRDNTMGVNDRPTGSEPDTQKGGIGYVLLWFMGVPIPLLILFALLRGCA